MSSAKDTNHKPEEAEIFSRGKCDEMFCRRKKYTVWRIFWGLFFIVAAAAVVLSALGILTFGINIGWLVLSIFLAAIFLRSLFSLHWFGVFIPAAGIITILARATDTIVLTDSAIGAVWTAAVLLAIGFSVLFHRQYKSYHWHHHKAAFHGAPYDRNPHTGRKYDKHEHVINSEDDSEIFVDVNFGSTVKYINTKDFRHAALKSNFGSITAYFDNADIQTDKAVIEINGSFSGIELYLPKTWQVVNNINCSLAGVEEKNSPRPPLGPDPKAVTLIGSLNLSGLEIIYV
jgi:hypothetical protein